MSLDTTPTTWTAGSIPPASQFNTEIRDAITGIQAASDTYTPTMSVWTLGNGTLVGRWFKVGHWIDVRIEYTIGSTDTLAAGSPTWALPATAVNSMFSISVGPTVGRCMLFDTSGAVRNYYDACLVTGGAAVRPLSNAGAGVSNTLPWTWATGDVLQFDIRYERA